MAALMRNRLLQIKHHKFLKCSVSYAAQNLPTAARPSLIRDRPEEHSVVEEEWEPDPRYPPVKPRLPPGKLEGQSSLFNFFASMVLGIKSR